ncbi:unnamed protein product [Notodromas monacha]|uniref:MIF4G domain-containing protein n=1 Tax=Notodromas monacha TaxID=399045 RepID=A0A7R9BKZ0_9CRUS|nr:unnamed protein product [Notodromas monacha]CAG0916570.1 unnamed protein product [Notodromas monacha]
MVTKLRPPIELYRPPSLRTDGDGNDGEDSSSLSVSLMFRDQVPQQNPRQSSTSSQHQCQDTVVAFSSLPDTVTTFAATKTAPTTLQLSKSTTNLAGMFPAATSFQSSQIFNGIPFAVPISTAPKFQARHDPGLYHHQTASSAAVRHHFQHQQPVKGRLNDLDPQPTSNPKFSGASLKRSKSLGSTDFHKKQQELRAKSAELLLHQLPTESREMFAEALSNPKDLSVKRLMKLAEATVECAVADKRLSRPCAEICASITQREPGLTFTESLLNTSRDWFMQRNEKLLLSGNCRDAVKWNAFVAFVAELYFQMKSQREKSPDVKPAAILLQILYECVYVSLKAGNLNNHLELEALTLILTSVGKDLDAEKSRKMDNLFSAIRENFLLSADLNPEVKKTLLQLVELRASGWQLSKAATVYYYLNRPSQLRRPLESSMFFRQDKCLHRSLEQEIVSATR